MAGPENRFRQTITYAVLTGRDTYGKPTMGGQSTAKARVQPSRKLIRDKNGNEHLSTHIVYTTAAIGVNHRVWLPGANTAEFNEARRPIDIDESVDGEGVTRFRKVYF